MPHPLVWWLLGRFSVNATFPSCSSVPLISRRPYFPAGIAIKLGLICVSLRAVGPMGNVCVMAKGFGGGGGCVDKPQQGTPSPLLTPAASAASVGTLINSARP